MIADRPINPNGLGLTLPAGAAAAPHDLGGKSLGFASANGDYLRLYYLDRPIDATMTRTDFFTAGGIRLDETPISSTDAQRYVADLVVNSGGRALAMPVGPYAAALVWADPSKAVDLRTHNLYWADEDTLFGAIALMPPETLVNIVRGMVCASR
ncbi:MAG: hypothetical protein HY263_00205 [Chloroflexi bacterium]|nr:hypothetical protein [Chloroflexota bacterium]